MFYLICFFSDSLVFLVSEAVHVYVRHNYHHNGHACGLMRLSSWITHWSVFKHRYLNVVRWYTSLFKLWSCLGILDAFQSLDYLALLHGQVWSLISLIAWKLDDKYLLLFSTFFSRASLGAAAGGFAFILFFVPFFIIEVCLHTILRSVFCNCDRARWITIVTRPPNEPGFVFCPRLVLPSALTSLPFLRRRDLASHRKLSTPIQMTAIRWL